MFTLINKNNNNVKIILPEVEEGTRFFMISPKYIEHWYDRNSSIYLNKNDWYLEKNY